MKIRPFSSSIACVPVRPRALGALACALLLAPACSSDEPAADVPLSGPGPSVLSGDPGAPEGDPVVLSGDPVVPEPGSPGLSEAPPAGEPLSAPPVEEEPPATETNFLVPPCRKEGAGDAGAGASDAGVGGRDAGLLDAGPGAGEQPDAAAASESFDLGRCG
jgi:hypothetical protein